MPLLRILRLAAWTTVALCAVFTVAVVTVFMNAERSGSSAVVSTGRAAIGGPFELTDHHGRRVSEKDFAGKPLLVFFGFTHCPDVCPTTLVEISEWLEAMGPDANRLRALFVTVDPERDTPDVLHAYLSSFDPRIVGLTGTSEEVDAMVAGYKSHRAKVPTGSDSYAMEHTSVVFLMQGDGTFLGTVDRREERSAALAKVRRLLGAKAAAI